MRAMMRRKIVLPVLLAAIAALVGGLFAGLGGPDPTENTQAHSGSGATHNYHFHFMPPTGNNNTTQKLTCGWHSRCDSKNNPNAAYSLDFDIEGPAGDGVVPHAGTPVYMRGYGYTTPAGHTTRTQPFTTAIFSWPKGKAGSFTSCYAVESAFYRSESNAEADSASLGRYRIYHIETTRHGSTYKPYFNSEGALNLSSLGTAVAGSREAASCPSSGTHAHVTRDNGNSNWSENKGLYPTMKETEDGTAEKTTFNNTDRLNWTHQLCLSGACPKAVVPDPVATALGSSTVSQPKARQDAGAKASAKLPPGTQNIQYTTVDLPQVKGTTGNVSATGTGGGSSRQAAIDAAKQAAAAKLPAGTTGITYGTATVTGGQREEYSHTFSVSGTSSTRAGARSAALVNWRNTADNLSNLVRLGTRGVTTVSQTATDKWQATATGKVTRWRLVNDTRVEYDSTVTVEATASTKATARQAALIRWRNVADNLPNFVRLGSRGIASVRQISKVTWTARVSGTVILYRITPYAATIKASGQHTPITYHAKATATGKAPTSPGTTPTTPTPGTTPTPTPTPAGTNRAPTASASGTPATVAGGGVVTLDGTAADPNSGDTLTYAWVSDGGGTFADATALDTTWTAPAATKADQAVTLTLTVTDDGGLSDTATVAVTVRADDPCVEDLGTLASAETRSGTWADDCDSEHRSGKYARYYSFTLGQKVEVTIALTSTDTPRDDTYLFLLEGAGRDGDIITQNDDIPGSRLRDSRIVRTLAAGTYTAEATTYGTAVKGGFTLTVTPAGAVATAPVPPAAPTVKAAGDTSLTASWAAPANGGSAITAYDVRHIEAGADDWTVVDSAWTSGALSHTVTGLEAGTTYNVQVRATNSVGTGGWSPSGSATTTGTKTVNRAPTVSASGNPATVDGKGAVALTGTAADPDGDSLTYAWSSSGGGSFAAASALSTTWTAPAATATAQSITLTLTVTDGRGGTASATVSVTVNAKPADQKATASITAIPRSVDGGDTVVLLGSVSAPAGYRYTTAWSSSGGGTFGEVSDLSTTWTAPAATATAQEITLTLTVTGRDGGGSVSATVTITVAAEVSGCLVDLGTLTAAVTTRTGSWDSDCASTHRNGRYARFYTFTLSERTRMTIELTSTDRPPDNTYLLLLSGAGKNGRTIAANNDIDRRTNQNSRIVKTLAAGSYTVEATTLFPATEGRFSLKLAP